MNKDVGLQEKKIPWAKPQLLNGNEKKYMLDALESTWISDGPYVEKFQKQFLQFHGAEYGVAVSNGTTALQLAYLAVGIKPGDEVIVPNFCFVAPGNMVIAIGATPVFADVTPDTWCLDPQSVITKISPKTKAIVAVHSYGNICDMKALSQIAKEHQLILIEDVAEALFSKYEGQMAGTLADIASFSFQATKTITMGEGGFVTFKNPELAKSVGMIRSHGMGSKRYWHELVGYNFRVTNTTAAIGLAQLEQAPEFIRARAALYKKYDQYLRGQRGVQMQKFGASVEPVVWAVALKLDPNEFKLSRDEVIQALSGQGIETRPGFYCSSEQPLYRPWVKFGDNPVSEQVSRQVISLPFFVGLRDKDVERICSLLLNLRK